jgi:RNA polymerase sigma-70 factor (ECF subfamily)
MGFLRSFSKDDQLLAGFISGSDSNFEQLIGRHSTQLFNTALHITGSLNLAEEVVTNVFYRAYQEIDTISVRTTIKIWLYRITVEAALEAMNSLKELEVIEINSLMEHKLCALQDNELLIGRQMLIDAMHSLPSEYKCVFVLKDIIGFTRPEVAEVLEISDLEVQARLHRARRMILRIIDRQNNRAMKESVVGVQPCMTSQPIPRQI